MTSEWPTIDPSADLFGGDLFGDELLDMYNPSVAPMNNILPEGGNGHDQQHSHSHMNRDDVLGALQHSSSINDFTSILEDNNTITILPSPAKIHGHGHVDVEPNVIQEHVNATLDAHDHSNSLSHSHSHSPANVVSNDVNVNVGSLDCHPAARSSLSAPVSVSVSVKAESASVSSGKKRPRDPSHALSTDSSPSKKSLSRKVSANTVTATGMVGVSATSPVLVSSGAAVTVAPLTVNVKPTTATTTAVQHHVGGVHVNVQQQHHNLQNLNMPVTPVSNDGCNHDHDHMNLNMDLGGSIAENQKKMDSKAAVVAAVAQHVVNATVPLQTQVQMQGQGQGVGQGQAVKAASSSAAISNSVSVGAAVQSAVNVNANAGKVHTTVSLNGNVNGNGPKLSIGVGACAGSICTSNDAMTVNSGASTSSGGAKTEESFKGVAQAAVTNLILSAGNTANRNKEESDAFVKGVDTSTAHVAALTSNNWVAACAASISGAPPGSAQAAQAAALAAASDPAAAKAARARRATLTADERARQNRDRNREHARNTRLRKKAYVEELKRTLTELVSQRDAAEVEKRHEKQRDLEVREVRYRVMEEFLKLRAKGSEQNLLARWIAILEDGFSLTLPKTPYRPSVANAANANAINAKRAAAAGASPQKQVLLNANQCFEDASKLASFISSAFMGNAVQQTYHCERAQFMMDGVKAILNWTLKVNPAGQTANAHTSTGNATSVSIAAPSFTIQGVMRATFSPASNKLASAELLFDTGYAESHLKSLKAQQSLCPIEETDALLDSVLPQVSSDSVPVTVKSQTQLPSSVSVVSTEKDASSDEEGGNLLIKMEPQTA